MVDGFVVSQKEQKEQGMGISTEFDLEGCLAALDAEHGKLPEPALRWAQAHHEEMIPGLKQVQKLTDPRVALQQRPLASRDRARVILVEQPVNFRRPTFGETESSDGPRNRDAQCRCFRGNDHLHNLNINVAVLKRFMDTA